MTVKQFSPAEVCPEETTHSFVWWQKMLTHVEQWLRANDHKEEDVTIFVANDGVFVVICSSSKGV